MAGIGPDEVDLAEVHDCFAIAELIACEDLGFCPRGEAGRMVADGITARDGKRPINASGGLIGKGHPIGATGTGQVFEVVNQLRGRADEPSRQIAGARIGLTHNVGGSGGSVAVHILKALD
jgi:acetyl-CoA acetyltransferase